MQTFCQICRHPSPGHEPGCPVGTGEPVSGMQHLGSNQGMAEQSISTGNSLQAFVQEQPEPEAKRNLTIIWDDERREILFRLAAIESQLGLSVPVGPNNIPIRVGILEGKLLAITAQLENLEDKLPILTAQLAALEEGQTLTWPKPQTEAQPVKFNPHFSAEGKIEP